MTETNEDGDHVSLPLEIGPLDIGGPLSLRLTTPFRLPRRIDLAFDAMLVGEGWHGCESANGLPFRWMGQEDSATIWLAVDRSVDLAVDIGILFMIDATFGDRIVVEAGEPCQPVPYERTHDGLSFILSQAPGPASPTKIGLRAPALVKEPDTRRLSLACSHIRIRPLNDNLSEATRLTLTMELSKRLNQDEAVALLKTSGKLQGCSDVG